MSRLATWADVIPYLGDPDGPDTCAHLSDSDIAAALVEETTPLGAAMLLSERHCRIVAAHDVRRRIAASAALQAFQEASREAQIGRAIAHHRQVGVQRLQERERVLETWRRLHDDRVQQCELRRARNHGPRCGAKTRTGEQCRRKPELGKRRCRNHGGCSTGPKTEAGRARALAALRRAREQRSAKQGGVAGPILRLSARQLRARAGAMRPRWKLCCGD